MSAPNAVSLCIAYDQVPCQVYNIPFSPDTCLRLMLVTHYSTERMLSYSVPSDFHILLHPQSVLGCPKGHAFVRYNTDLEELGCKCIQCPNGPYSRHALVGALRSASH